MEVTLTRFVRVQVPLSRLARRTRQQPIRTLQSDVLIQRGRGTGPTKPRQPSAVHDGASTVGA
jgi:hypothetical protein